MEGGVRRPSGRAAAGPPAPSPLSGRQGQGCQSRHESRAPRAQSPASGRMRRASGGELAATDGTTRSPRSRPRPAGRAGPSPGPAHLPGPPPPPRVKPQPRPHFRDPRGPARPPDVTPPPTSGRRSRPRLLAPRPLRDQDTGCPKHTHSVEATLRHTHGTAHETPPARCSQAPPPAARPRPSAASPAPRAHTRRPWAIAPAQRSRSGQSPRVGVVNAG